jgi:predicted transcriptional regulator of viral defense system
MGFSSYVNNLIAQGKCYFALDDAEKVLGKTRKAILSSIEHLAAKKEIAVPAKGFYVIVPPEYRVLGCIPPEHFIPYLMRYWGHRYYAGLLTAARYHGASHQAAQVFQVMTDIRCPPIHCGKVRIQFITNRHLLNTPVKTISTPRSMLNISTSESTAMDLLNYPQQSGGLNHIATVLAELKETMQPKNLQSLAEAQPRLAWKQRLGVKQK